MKKWGAILLAFTLLIGLFPQLTQAAQPTKFDQDFAKYLEDVSKVRGFKVTRDNIEESLTLYGESIDNFTSVAELKEFLGEVINKDLSNLDSIYTDYQLDQTSLQALLQEYGQDLNDYIYLQNLDTDVSFYRDASIERDPNFDQNLVTYLADVSAKRGFTVTKQDIEASLSLYEETLEDFATVEELSDFLGEVIKADLSNLDYLYDNYDLTQEELFQLIEDNGKTIDDYIYIDDLEQLIWPTFDGDFPISEEELLAALMPIFEEVDLSSEEIQRLKAHILSLQDEFATPETIAKLEELGNRMMAFEDFETISDLSSDQIAELASIYQEFLSIFKLNISFSLVKADSETPLSLVDLLSMKELKGANLKVSIYNLDGEFLADMIITGDMVDSDTIIDTGKQINQSAEQISKTTKPVVKKPVVKTVKGAKLPKTASDYLPNALLGLFLIIAGIVGVRRVRNVGIGNTQK